MLKNLFAVKLQEKAGENPSTCGAGEKPSACGTGEKPTK